MHEHFTEYNVYDEQTYQSGVYSDPQCTSDELNHAVVLVGYGTYCGAPYWLLKNR